jgi:hypothetical protein
MSEVFLAVNELDGTHRHFWVPFKVLAKQYDSEQAAKADADLFCAKENYSILFIGNCFYVAKELRMAL